MTGFGVGLAGTGPCDTKTSCQTNAKESTETKEAATDDDKRKKLWTRAMAWSTTEGEAREERAKQNGDNRRRPEPNATTAKVKEMRKDRQKERKALERGKAPREEDQLTARNRQSQ